jgi:hypothetical protein
MSTKYPGGFITKAPVAPTSSAASGIWTLDQQQQAQKAGTWPSPPIFIEDLFSTYLYTGNGSTQTITNGIDLSGNGGLVWIKDRSRNTNHWLADTVRGVNKLLSSDTTSAQDNTTASLTAFNSNGFSIDATGGYTNINGDLFASWTFREQPKFFDVVTYTGNGTAGRQISHNLGSTPGCIIVKCTSTTSNWPVYHAGVASSFLTLNSTNANQAGLAQYYWGDDTSFIAPTSTVFTVGGANAGNDINASGQTYVAYLWANNAGGFPVSGGGSTNGISCGSVTSDSSGNASVNLGYEPQWVLLKNTTGAQYWYIVDNMRGLFAKDKLGNGLFPNSSSGETAGLGTSPWINSTGMEWNGSYNPLAASSTYIYVAIRRGPMKPPTVGTSVFVPRAVTEPVSLNTVDLGITSDLIFNRSNLSGTGSIAAQDRLRGMGNYVITSSTAAEASTGDGTFGAGQTSVTWPSFNATSTATIDWIFRRAPGFFDEVCATCPSSGDFQITHNLSVVPEFVITKSRSNSNAWFTYHKDLGRSLYLTLNSTVAQTTGTDHWNTPTTTTFGTPVGIFFASGWTAVFYMFATVAGVSKVGSYTGTGALQTVNCGFTSGARFVLIKRTDSTGDWFTYDSARGITSGNDPYLLMNSTAAEVTGTNYVDTDTTGFKVTAAAPAGLNANGGNYIFLAIA